jgi:hypothetical protein
VVLFLVPGDARILLHIQQIINGLPILKGRKIRVNSIDTSKSLQAWESLSMATMSFLKFG